MALRRDITKIRSGGQTYQNGLASGSEVGQWGEVPPTKRATELPRLFFDIKTTRIVGRLWMRPCHVF